MTFGHVLDRWRKAVGRLKSKLGNSGAPGKAERKTIRLESEDDDIQFGFPGMSPAPRYAKIPRR